MGCITSTPANETAAPDIIEPFSNIAAETTTAPPEPRANKKSAPSAGLESGASAGLEKESAASAGREKKSAASAGEENSVASPGSDQAQLAQFQNAFLRATGNSGADITTVAVLSAALRILHVSLDATDVDDIFQEACADGTLDLSGFIVLVNRSVIANLLLPATEVEANPSVSAVNPAESSLALDASSLKFKVTPEHMMSFSSALSTASDDGFVRTPSELQTALSVLSSHVDMMEAEVLFDISEKYVYFEGGSMCIGLHEFATLCAKIGVEPSFSE